MQLQCIAMIPARGGEGAPADELQSLALDPFAAQHSPDLSPSQRSAPGSTLPRPGPAPSPRAKLQPQQGRRPGDGRGCGVRGAVLDGSVPTPHHVHDARATRMICGYVVVGTSSSPSPTRNTTGATARAGCRATRSRREKASDRPAGERSRERSGGRALARRALPRALRWRGRTNYFSLLRSIHLLNTQHTHARKLAKKSDNHREPDRSNRSQHARGRHVHVGPRATRGRQW